MDRAQINTLEAFIAILLIVGGLIFASQATAVTPLSASTSSQHIENQQAAMANDLLSIAEESGSLTEGITYWNAAVDDETEPHFRHAREEFGFYTGIEEMNPDSGEANPLYSIFNDAFTDGVYAINIDLAFKTPDGEIETYRMLQAGTPSDNAVSASRTILLYDTDTLSTDESDETLAEIDESSEYEFWAPNQDDDEIVFAVVEVTITVWRM